MTLRVKHAIRSAYHYTDKDIVDHIGQYGSEWATDAYKLIMEDEFVDKTIMLAIVQAARTPQTKKGGRVMQKYVKSLRRELSLALTPWRYKGEVSDSIKDRLSRPPEPVVIAEGPGPDTEWLAKKKKEGSLEVRESV